MQRMWRGWNASGGNPFNIVRWRNIWRSGNSKSVYNFLLERAAEKIPHLMETTWRWCACPDKFFSELNVLHLKFRHDATTPRRHDATTLTRHQQHPISSVSTLSRFAFCLAPAGWTRPGFAFRPKTAGAHQNASRFTQKRREIPEATPVSTITGRLHPAQPLVSTKNGRRLPKRVSFGRQTAGVACFSSISPQTPNC